MIDVPNNSQGYMYTITEVSDWNIAYEYYKKYIRVYGMYKNETVYKEDIYFEEFYSGDDRDSNSEYFSFKVKGFKHHVTISFLEDMEKTGKAKVVAVLRLGLSKDRIMLAVKKGYLDVTGNNGTGSEDEVNSKVLLNANSKSKMREVFILTDNGKILGVFATEELANTFRDSVIKKRGIDVNDEYDRRDTWLNIVQSKVKETL